MDEAQLDGIPLFAGLTLDQRASIASVCDELEVEEGATLVKEGDFGFAAFAITSGTADVVQTGTSSARSAPATCSARSPYCREGDAPPPSSRRAP